MLESVTRCVNKENRADGASGLCSRRGLSCLTVKTSWLLPYKELTVWQGKRINKCNTTPWVPKWCEQGMGVGESNGEARNFLGMEQRQMSLGLLNLHLLSRRTLVTCPFGGYLCRLWLSHTYGLKTVDSKSHLWDHLYTQITICPTLTVLCSFFKKKNS